MLGTRVGVVPRTPSQVDLVQEINWKLHILQPRVLVVDVGEVAIYCKADELCVVVIGETDVVPLMSSKDLWVTGRAINHDPGTEIRVGAISLASCAPVTLYP